MKNQLLLPPVYRKIGLSMLVPSIAFGLICLFYDDAKWLDFKVLWPTIGTWGQPLISMMKMELANTIAITLNLISLIFIALSKEKVEDECISQIRARAMLQALWYSMGLIFLSTLFFFDFAYIYVLIFNIYFYLIFFCVTFRREVAKFYKSQNDE